MMHHRENNKGFSLVETIVAITILMVGIVGPLTLASQHIKAAQQAEYRLTATLLAQEGIEVVRNVIANNMADSSVAGDWLRGVTSNPLCDNAPGCIPDVTMLVEPDSGDPSELQQSLKGGCNVASCVNTVYQSADGFFRQDDSPLPAGWTPTQFTRLISVEVAEPGKRIIVSVTVEWSKGSIMLQEDIYNWYFQL